MREEAKARNRNDRYGLAYLRRIEELADQSRLPEELNSIRDCVEEALFVIGSAYSVSAMVRDPRELRRNQGALYDRIEAIIKRAQSLPLEADPDSSDRQEQNSE